MGVGRGYSQVPFLLAERARLEGARSMRAVKGNLATPSLSVCVKGPSSGESISPPALRDHGRVYMGPVLLHATAEVGVDGGH